MTSRSETVWCGMDIGSSGNPGGVGIIAPDGVFCCDLESSGIAILGLLRDRKVRHLEIEEPIILGKMTSKKAHGAMREQLGYILACRDIYSSEGLTCSWELVKPNVWMKSIFQGTKRPSGVEGKRADMEKARQLFPDAEIETFDQADALLIAAYARRVHG